jgi:toxin ParE1/3/4
VKVEITRRARIDLIEIGDYLERVASRRTALRWMERLEARALRLASHPYAGAEDAELGGRRRVVVRPYLVVYRIISADHVRVARIVHGARDLPVLFAADDEGS